MGKGVAAGKHCRVAGDVREADLAIVEQRMLGGDHEVQRVVPHRRGLDQGVGFRRQGDHRQFGPSVEDFFVSDFRIEKLDIQRHLGIAPGELP
ncbi:hypothetical protein D3C80_2027140 [compost metagenome]